MNDLNDEFFIDDDIIVSFDDNIIEEVIPGFNVIEERLKDDTILRLNKDQINAEITNLVISNNKNASKLKNKVLKYATLFSQYPHIPTIQFKQIAPVILVDKLTYFLNDDEHTQNKEYEHEHFLKSDKLSNFLSQFQSLNSNKGYKSGNGISKLYALYAPFSRREQSDVATLEYKSEYDVDAIWHCQLEQFGCDNKEHETFRLISKISFNQEDVYEGDVVDVIGFYNIVKDAKDTITIDIRKYISDISNLKQGDKVQVVFNEPAFDLKYKDLITHVNAKVKFVRRNTIEIDLPSPITLKGDTTHTLTFSLKSFDNEYFIYPLNTPLTNIFGKQLLSTHNILFKFHDIYINSRKFQVDEIMSFISPTSIGQYILMYKHKFSKIFNVYDLSKYILKDGGIETDALTVEYENLIKYIFSYGKDAELSLTRPILKRRFEREYPYLNTSPLVDFVKYKEELQKYKSYNDYSKLIDDALNRFRYLKSQNDKGAYYFLKRVKLKLKKKYKNNIRNMDIHIKELNKIYKELEKLDLQSIATDNSCYNTTKQQKFAKEYTNLNALIEDNDKIIYFDMSHDDTEYSLKSGFKGESKREMKLYVLNEITSIDKFKNLSKSQLDFEVESIVKGRRKVRIGDVCVLHTFQGDTVYVRQEVAGKQMWVKKFKTPFKICSDNPLVKYNDIMQLDTCIKESFDDVCKTNGNARILYKYRVLMSLKTELSNLINLIDKYETIIDTLEFDISYYEHLIGIIPSEHDVKRNFEYIDHVDYEEFTGEQYIEGDSVQYQIDFNDQGNFVITPQSKLSSPEENDQQQEDSGNSKDKQDMLNMLLSSIELPIDELEFAYILSNVNAKASKTTIEVNLKKFEASLWQNVNEVGYKTNEKYKSLVDTTMKQKLEKKELELMKRYHFNTLRFMIAMIIILMFVRYPNYALRKVIPSCISFLSYSGYPLTSNDGERSLIKYFACLIAKVTDDMRFELYQDKDAKEIEKQITDAIDELLSDNYELKVQLDMAKTVFASSKQYTDYEIKNLDIGKYMTSFKPKYVFLNIDNAPPNYKLVLKYMKSIHDTIVKSKIIKQNIVSVPNLFNSCCTEVLTKEVDFFNYFQNTSTFQNAQNNITQMKKKTYVDINLYPPRKEKISTDIFAKKIINHNNSIPTDKKIDDSHLIYIGKVKEQLQYFILSNNETYRSGLEGLVENFNSNNWWYDVFYPKLNNEFDILVDVLKKVGNNINEDMITLIKETIVSINNQDSSSSIRNTLHMFLKNKLKSIIGTILNKQQSKDENFNEDTLKSSPTLSIISSISNNKHYDNVLPILKMLLVGLKDIDYLYFDTNDNDLILKNISLLAYVLLLFFNEMIRATTTKEDNKSLSLSTLVYDVDIQTKDKLSITSLIIHLCFEKLALNLENSIVDQTYLKMVVERLREQRKEELIAAFRVDDEERMMQNVLKKMGLENWANVFTTETDDEVSEEVQVMMNPQSIIKDEYEEEKDIIYSTYQGENYENDENEEDYVSYEAYDF